METDDEELTGTQEITRARMLNIQMRPLERDQKHTRPEVLLHMATVMSDYAHKRYDGIGRAEAMDIVNDQHGVYDEQEDILFPIDPMEAVIQSGMYVAAFIDLMKWRHAQGMTFAYPPRGDEFPVIAEAADLGQPPPPLPPVDAVFGAPEPEPDIRETLRTVRWAGRRINIGDPNGAPEPARADQAGHPI